MSREVWGAQRTYEGRRAQVYENRARQASSYSVIETTGWGEFEVPERIDFDAVYVEMPFMSYSFAIDGDTLIDGAWPRVGAMVTEWDVDNAGNYVGCWVGVTVDIAGLPLGVPSTVTVPPEYALKIMLTFTGVALKAAPLYKIKG